VAVDAAHDGSVQLFADVLLRDAGGEIIGGWAGAATRSGVAIEAPPGRSTAEIDVPLPREWLPPGATGAQVEVSLGAVP
jgi:hypothetical protein